MKKQIFFAAIITLLCAAALGGIKFLKVRSVTAEMSQRKPPPEAVTSYQAKEEDWPVVFKAVGSISPVQGATLGAEEIGRVDKILFESGELVEQGKLLVQLDVSVEEAQLRGAAAQAELATATLAREKELRQKGANSIAALDEASARQRSALAEIETLKARIARKKIVAPFTGRTGIRQVNAGQIVLPGSPIVSLQSFDPVYVDFSLPQQALERLRTGLEVRVAVDAFPGTVFSGLVSAIDARVDESTRNIGVQATIPNPEEKLRTGMFSGVTVVLPASEKVIAVPGSSISYAPYGDTVFIIEKMKAPDGTEYSGVRQQVVKPGRSQGDRVAIVSGLKPGDEVVTSGGFKLRPGAAVRVDNTVVPDNSLSPNPEDT